MADSVRLRRSLSSEHGHPRRSLSLDIMSHETIEAPTHRVNEVQTPREENKRRLSNEENRIPDSPSSPLLTKLSSTLKRIGVNSPSSNLAPSLLNVGLQAYPEKVNRNLQTLEEYYHREDSSFLEEVEILSQGSTRDGSTFDLLQHNAEQTQKSQIESCFSLLSPDRKGPERKKSRVKLNSPEHVAMLNCSLRSSDATMSVEFSTSRPRSESVTGCYADSAVAGSITPPRPTAFSRCISSPVRSPSQLQEPKKKLETFQEECILDCVSVETVAALLRGSWRHLYKRVIIFDCRYDFEFDGGHIEGHPPWLMVYHVPPDAKQTAERILFKECFGGTERNPSVRDWRQQADRYCGGSEVCVIFHCEFSKSRGPSMMKHIRSIDRSLNQNRYPHLFYPEMYLMKGGYKEFFSRGEYQELCKPMSYTRMDDKNHLTKLQEHQRKNTFKKKHRQRNEQEEPLSFLQQRIAGFD